MTFFDRDDTTPCSLCSRAWSSEQVTAFTMRTTDPRTRRVSRWLGSLCPVCVKNLQQGMKRVPRVTHAGSVWHI